MILGSHFTRSRSLGASGKEKGAERVRERKDLIRVQPVTANLSRLRNEGVYAKGTWVRDEGNWDEFKKGKSSYGSTGIIMINLDLKMCVCMWVFVFNP